MGSSAFTTKGHWSNFNNAVCMLLYCMLFTAWYVETWELHSVGTVSRTFVQLFQHV